MTENDKNGPKWSENDDFQGFSEDFGGISPLKPLKPALSREAQEMLGGMERRYARIQQQMLSHQRNAPRALREESEALRANIAHFKRRWGID